MRASRRGRDSWHLVAVGGSLALAKLLHLSLELQRSLATRSVSTPFALAVSDKIHAPKARELGSEEGVVASLTMMIAGVMMVLLVPVLGMLPI